MVFNRSSRMKLTSSIKYTFPPLVMALILSLNGCERFASHTEQEHIQRAKDFEGKRDFGSAVIELKNAVLKNPNNAQTRWLLGELYLKLNSGAEAEKELVKARELGVAMESVKVSLGEAYLLQGKNQEVLGLIKPTGETSQANRAKILRIQGDAQLGLRKLEEGCQLYDEARQLDARYIPALLGLANCAYAKQDLALARSRLDAALQIDQRDPQAWIALGDLERMEGKLAEAEAAYDTALKHDPDKLPALISRTQIYLATGKLDAAKKDLDRIYKLEPGHYMVDYLRAWSHYAKGNTADALSSIQKSIRIRPNHLPSVFLLGMLHYEQKSYELALSSFNRYLKDMPASIDVRKILAATYLKLDQADEALATLQPILAAKLDDAQVFALAGEAYLRNKRSGSATELFEKASELVPLNTALRTKLALGHLQAGDEKSAVAQLEQAAGSDSGGAQADYALILHFLRTQQHDKALLGLAKLEKKLPKSPVVHNLRGVAYVGKKDHAKARKSFEQALALQPNYMDAVVQLAELDISEGKEEAARKRFEDILARDKGNVSAMLAFAHFALKGKKEKEYVGWLEKAAQTDPKAIKPRALLVAHYLEKRDAQKALSIASEVRANNPQDHAALALLANTQLEAGNRENALASYNQLVQKAPNSAVAHFGLAKAELSMGNAVAARAALKKALQVKPDHSEAQAALVHLELATGKLEEGLRLAREYQSRSPESPLGFSLEGDAHAKAGRYAEAVRAYEQSLGKNRNGTMIAKLHEAMTLAGLSGKADSITRGWLKAHPQDALVRNYFADSLARRGLGKAAIEQYQAILDDDPNNARVLNNLANLYLASKDSRALSTAEAAYRLHPGNPAYADTVGWILVMQGKAEEGLDLLKKAASAAPGHPEIRYHLAYTLAKTGQKTQARREIQELEKMRLTPELKQQIQQLAGTVR